MSDFSSSLDSYLAHAVFSVWTDVASDYYQLPPIIESGFQLNTNSKAYSYYFSAIS